MNARERFLAALRFQPTDRPFRWDTLGMWPETLDRWYAEGLSTVYKNPAADERGAMKNDEFQRVLVNEFALDRLDYLRGAVISGYTDTPFVPAFERQVLEDDGHTRLIRDTDGIIKRELSQWSSSSMPQFVKFPVTGREDFMALAPRLDADQIERLAPDWNEQCAYYAARDFPVGLTICGAFGHPRNLFGVEDLCMAYYEQPGLVTEIMEHWVDFYCRLCQRVWQGIQYDFLMIWEDMAYKGGSLISPKLVKQFMLPYYRKVIETVRGLGCNIIIVDSDGDVSQLAPLFISAGVNVMLPFEVQAGMDVRTFRKQYGKNLAIIGGIDKRVLAQGKAAMDAELEQRVQPLLAGGGYIPCLDHTAPPDVSLEAFRYYIQKVRTFTGQ
jgi:hypothetical protein